MTPAETVLWVTLGVLVAGWFLYFEERERSRDYATDLVQVVHDHDLGREDLRRSLERDEIADRIDREDSNR